MSRSPVNMRLARSIGKRSRTSHTLHSTTVQPEYQKNGVQQLNTAGVGEIKKKGGGGRNAQKHDVNFIKHITNSEPSNEVLQGS